MHWKTQENKGAHQKTWQNIRKQGYIGKQGDIWENMQGKTQEYMGEHRNTLGYMGKQENRKEKAGRENIAKPQKNRGKKENTGINGNTDTGEAQENRGQKQ